MSTASATESHAEAANRWGSSEQKKTEDEKEQNKKNKKKLEKKTWGKKRKTSTRFNQHTSAPHLPLFTLRQSILVRSGIHTECSEPQATNVAKPDVEQAEYILVRPWPAFPQRCGEKKQQGKLSHNQYLKKMTSAAQNGKKIG